MFVIALFATGCSGKLDVCGAGKLQCNGACVDTTTDSSNCGTCGYTCVSGYSCVQSVCTKEQQVVCQGSTPDGCGNVCVNFATDRSHCGSCTNVCAVSDACESGACVPPTTCAPGLVDCGGQCVNILADYDDCGGCGIACAPSDYCDRGTCTSGSCVPDDSPCNADGQCCSLLCASDGLCGCIPSGNSGCNADSDCCSGSCDPVMGTCN